VGRRNKEKRKEKQVGKNRPAFILIKNLQFKTRERKQNKTIAQKLPTLGPVFWAEKYFTVCTKKTVKNYQSTACLEDISSSKNKAISWTASEV